MRLNRGAALLSALVLSFTTYLIPIYHLHAGWLFLGSVLSGLNEASTLSVAWVGASLLFQGIAFGLFFWLLISVRWSRFIVLLVSTPLFVIVANLSLLYAIPLLVLVETDTRPEVGALELECSIPDTTVAQVHSGSDLSLVRAGEAWLVVSPQRTRALLRMPGCALIALDVPIIGSTIDSVAPGGRLLHRGDSGELFFVSPETENLVPLTAPPVVSYWNPILSDDGLVLVWLERAHSEGGTGAHLLRTREISNGREQTVALELPARDQFTLIGARSQRGPFTLARFRNAVLSIDLHGKVVRGPISPNGIYDARWGFLWLEDGWVAWDGYREEGRSRIVWELPEGHGEAAMPRGRGIDSLSVAQDGRIIAVSISSNVRIGDAKSAVILFRTSDGAEIYRRYHPTLTRTNLAFLGSEHLAVTKFENRQAVVNVYLIPTLVNEGN
ncbi:MAG: hypothetical protein OEN23_08675 [Paracoccaceae bacterium]|nr:hypothetical protein [Paracoccaceae bacterium]